MHQTKPLDVASVADPDLDPVGSVSGFGSGYKATKIDIFLPFFVLKRVMNT
jgi:hypothetical protein